MSGGRRITLSLDTPLIVDLSRVWRADQQGVARPAPEGSRDEARALLEEYERQAAGESDAQVAEFYRGRAREIRAHLDGGA